MEDNAQIRSTEPKPALITPSASPPHSHSIPDQPSPTKRPRLLSAPRQIQQRASSSSSTQNETFNFYRAREESAMRLFDVWTGLAERYSRRLDEDDIIDVTTGKVVKDRGVLRGSQTFHVGVFADPNPEDAEDELEDDDEDDDLDELDSCANPVLSDMKAQLLANLDSRDAQDFKEFMEAEQRRREIYGSEGSETEGSTYESQPEDAMEEYDRGISQEGSEGAVDSESDDELGGWDLKEASAVYRLHKEGDNDSEIEAINIAMQQTPMSPEVPLPPWTSPTTRPRLVSIQRQLQTPPKSHSSAPSTTPDDFSGHPPPTSPPRSSSPIGQYDSSPIKSRTAARGLKKPISERKRTIPSQAQPKHSSHPIPRLDLAKVSAEPLIEIQHVFQTSSNSSKVHSSDSASTNMKKQSRMTSVKPANQTRGKSKQPVFDGEVQTRLRTPVRAASEWRNDVSKEEEIKRKPRLTAKAKRKEKAASTDERAKSPQEDLVRRSSPPLALKSDTSHSQSLRHSVPKSSLASQAEPLLGDVGSSPRKPKPMPLATRRGPMPGGKRKREVSSNETVEETRTSAPEPSTEDVRRHHSRSRHQSTDAFDTPEIAQDTSSGHVEKRKHNLQRRLPSAECESDDASQEEEFEQGQRHSSRAPSRFNTPYYPYLPPLYPTYQLPNQQQPIYTPLQDPRAHHIFTQAMQQIFAIGSGAWGPPPPPPVRGSTPFTPKHRGRHRKDPPPLPIYSTPMHHPHPYPYSYDPMLSNATLPPSSPEVPSSPGMSASSGQPRRKLLVERGQSRGRRVSFREEESDIDALSEPYAYTDGAYSPDRLHASSSGSKKSRKKGKDNARDERLMSYSEEEGEPTSQPHAMKRGRPSTRHQTPGPSSRETPQRDIRRAPVARNKSRA